MAKKPRPRTARRASERAAVDIVRDKQRLARLARGGSAENPLEVDTPAIIDLRAQSFVCPLCDGKLRFAEQTADRVIVGRFAGEILRCTHLTCLQCGTPRRFWFRIVTAAAPN